MGVINQMLEDLHELTMKGKDSGDEEEDETPDVIEEHPIMVSSVGADFVPPHIQSVDTAPLVGWVYPSEVASVKDSVASGLPKRETTRPSGLGELVIYLGPLRGSAESSA